jgi:hypothetical protein
VVLHCHIVAVFRAMTPTPEFAVEPARERATPPEGSVHPPAQKPGALPREIGGREGPEPTRFGDWEKSGRCIDF